MILLTALFALAAAQASQQQGPAVSRKPAPVPKTSSPVPNPSQIPPLPSVIPATAPPPPPVTTGPPPVPTWPTGPIPSAAPVPTAPPQPHNPAVAACTSALATLVADYSTCIGPFVAADTSSTQAADAAASAFLGCICNSSWTAGSPQISAASVPICPAPRGISKADMAAIAAECAPSASPIDRRLVIQNFHINVTIDKLVYVPLSGYPPGRSPSTSSASNNIPFSALVLLFLPFVIQQML